MSSPVKNPEEVAASVLKRAEVSKVGYNTTTKVEDFTNLLF